MAEKCQYNKLLTQILQNLKKKLVAKELIPYGRLRGAREFTPQIFCRICKCTERTDEDKLACRLTKYVPEINVPSILNGKCYESLAIKCFEEKCDIKTPKMWHICVKVLPISCCLTR